MVYSRRTFEACQPPHCAWNDQSFCLSEKRYLTSLLPGCLSTPDSVPSMYARTNQPTIFVQTLVALSGCAVLGLS